jgi:hypothetical protein
MALEHWRRFPTWWIEEHRLKEFTWTHGRGADHTAALMLLAVVVHHADDSGSVQLTYDQLCLATCLSRAKVSAGLKILCEKDLLARHKDRQSVYALTKYDPRRGWAKLPAKALYRDGEVRFFRELKLRARPELDALKLYLLFVARRDRNRNVAFVTYDQITTYTGIDGGNIRSALSLLTVNAMVMTEQVLSTKTENRIANAYRIPHIMSYVHGGTSGRGDDGAIGEALATELSR